MSTPARRRLMRDFKRLQEDPPAGVSGAPSENNIMVWNAVIFGPEGTPFEDGTLAIRVWHAVWLPQLQELHSCSSVTVLGQLAEGGWYGVGIQFQSDAMQREKQGESCTMRGLDRNLHQIDSPSPVLVLGTFKLTIEFTEEYPNKPPTVRFVSKMFHPNVYADGSICLDILQNRWSPTYDVSSILTSIQSLLDEPNPNSPANSQAAQLYQENKREYEKRVSAIVEQSWRDC
ncbi:hypothetical protein JZ751_015034 [Albula glossodonta]|uniref:UBC core domain-containing protein n=1 Tax=Albula glossodonta TaxID=121402 RepID=A0A8T2MRI3_9TELE|nr:hypothetical protein JZ751_015034 [Albula glossodonta]